MDSQILDRAKKDLPLYSKELNAFWDETVSQFADDDLTDSYANSLIFKNWTIALNHIGINNLDPILKELHEDINASFFLAHFGLYRSAHMHLRSVIELSLQLLYFIHHEIEFKQWKTGDFRIKHEELTEYLKKHPNLFGTSVVTLIGNITTDWKKFSKFIHAEAPAYFQSNLESHAKKSVIEKDFNIWKSSYLLTGYRLNKVFLTFFRERIKNFPTQTREILLRNMRDSDYPELGIEK